MLRKLLLQNFQRHERIKVVFDRITTFVGPNDAGKSALLRALRWIAFNKPSGNQFIRYGAKAMRGCLVFDSATVERHKGKGENRYVLDGKEYKAFGAEPPEDIFKAVRLSPEINFQRQHDPTFWFVLSPGQVAKELNKIVDLQVIDKITAAANRRISESKRQVEVLEQSHADAVASCERLAVARTAAESLASIEAQEATIVDLRSRCETLRQLLTDGQAAASARQRISHHIAALDEHCTRVRSSIDEAERLSSDASQLRTLIRDGIHARKSAVALGVELERQQAALELDLDGVCPLCKQDLNQ